MKVKTSIYKGAELHAQIILKGRKKDVQMEEAQFITNNLPPMTMTTKVKEGWCISRQYGNLKTKKQ